MAARAFGRPVERRTQPSRLTPPNWRDPLTEGLRMLYSGGYNHVNGQQAKRLGSVDVRLAADQGTLGVGNSATVTDGASATDCVSIPHNFTALELAATSATFLVAGVGGGSLTVSNTDATSAMRAGYLELRDFEDTWYAGGNRLGAGPGVSQIIRPGQFNTSAATYDGPTNDPRWYVNGRPLSASYIGFYGGFLSAGSEMTLHGTGTTRVALVAIWLRILSRAELAAVTLNPWQLFAPVERRVFFPAPVTIPTLTDATAVDLTSSSARPRVTLTF